MILAGKTVLITGANGFIGGRLAERLACEEDARVRALLRSDKALGPHLRDAEICRGDLTDPESLKQAVHGCSLVVHCAAMQGARGRLADFRRVNVQGTLDLVEASLGAGVERFIHLSTINVHGMPPPEHAHADSPLVYSGDPYSQSKAEGETCARDYAAKYGLPMVVVRPACTFGPRSVAWTLQPLARLRRGRPVLVGSGQGICNAIYIDNLVDLILFAMKTDAAVGHAFIGAEGRGVTWRDFYGAYAQMLGLSRLPSVPLAAALGVACFFEAFCTITGTPPRYSVAGVRFYSHQVVFDIDKSTRLLGYSPRVPFAEGMRRTREWLASTHQL